MFKDAKIVRACITLAVGGLAFSGSYFATAALSASNEEPAGGRPVLISGEGQERPTMPALERSVDSFPKRDQPTVTERPVGIVRTLYDTEGSGAVIWQAPPGMVLTTDGELVPDPNP